jgi:C-terminal processing protease CtpA/Prc
MFALLVCLFILAQGLWAGDVANRRLDSSERLACLGKVWGLLKYFHPDVASGAIDWDGVLLAAVPRVKGAEDVFTFNRELDQLIAEAGGIGNVESNATASYYPNEELFEWLKGDPIFTDTVREKLHLILKNYQPKDNHYIGYKPNSVVSLANETKFPDNECPDEGLRLLALFRYWNVINYFFPYKDHIDEDWDNVLREFVEPVLTATTCVEYAKTMKELTVRIDDTHGGMISQCFTRFQGEWYAPAEAAYIEGKTIVTGVWGSHMNPTGGLRVGDVILRCRGMDIDTFRRSIRKYIPASNEASRRWIIDKWVLRHRERTLPFTIERGGRIHTVDIQGIPIKEFSALLMDDRKNGEKWRILGDNIAYVNLEHLFGQEVPAVMSPLMDCNAIVFDLRGYPNGTMHWVVRFLSPHPKRFTKLHRPVKNYPGSFYMDNYFKTGMYNPNFFQGKIIILVNEETISQSEFNCLVFKIAPDVTIIGSQTAGADGDVTFVPLPGGITATFSGLGVYYPNGYPTQQIGIVPDIYCRPTVEGIRGGRDEVLEKAIEFVNNSR